MFEIILSIPIVYIIYVFVRAYQLYLREEKIKSQYYKLLDEIYNKDAHIN